LQKGGGLIDGDVKTVTQYLTLYSACQPNVLAAKKAERNR